MDRTVKVLSISVLFLFCIGVGVIMGNTIAGSVAVNSVAYAEAELVGLDSFTLMEYDGKLAVFQNGGEQPIDIMEVDVSSLRKTDRQMLQDGITVKDLTELYMLLEDYSN